MVYLNFSDFDINENISRALKVEDYFKPSKVQQQTIPLCLSDKDVIVQAKTGSGKTLSYLVPLLNNVTKIAKLPGVLSVILVPTSELAFQVADVLHRLIKYSPNIKYALLTGGRNKSGKNLEFKRSNLANILIATPGRLLELATNHIEFYNLQYLILDEADYLLEKTFIDDVAQLIDYLPNTHVTWLFSATQNFNEIQLAKLSLKDPVKVGLIDKSKYKTPMKLLQCYIEVPLPNKVEALWNLLEKKHDKKIIVFLSTQKEVLFIYRLFKALKPPYSIFHLRSGMRLDKRMVTLENFLAATQSGVLFATDVASRGLDINGVNLIVQYDIPREIDYYVHRAGRTARFNQDGTSILMVMPSEKGILKLLADKGIELKKLNATLFDPQSSEIAEKASVLYVHDQELYQIAKSAILGFIQDYQKRPPRISGESEDWNIFNFEELPIKEYCKSLGFRNIPDLGTELKVDHADFKMNSDSFDITTFIVPYSNSNFEFDSDSEDDEENVEDKQQKRKPSKSYKRPPIFDIEQTKEFFKQELEKKRSTKKEYFENKFSFKKNRVNESDDEVEESDEALPVEKHIDTAVEVSNSTKVDRKSKKKIESDGDLNELVASKKKNHKHNDIDEDKCEGSHKKKKRSKELQRTETTNSFPTEDSTVVTERKKKRKHTGDDERFDKKKSKILSVDGKHSEI